jgi:DNA-binding protein HU-beta
LNNKEFLATLANRLNVSAKVCNDQATGMLSEMSRLLADENTVSIQGFGSFEVKKRVERVVVNPVSHKRMLVPPKLLLAFKPSALLKEKLK